MYSIPQCIDFIKYKHRYQIRKYTTDVYYYTHCIEVMMIVSRSPMCTLYMKIAALLHDTLEDTDTTYEELKVVFGKIVADYVRGLTDVSDSKEIPLKPRKERKAMDRLHVSQQCAEVQTIKVADLLANAKDIMEKDPLKFGPVFLAEARLLLDVLTLACPALRQELDELLKRYNY